MEVELYIGNLSKITTEDELDVLFTQAGEVTGVEIFKDRESGESKGFGFVLMSAQSEADKAVSMFNRFTLNDSPLKVSLTKPREVRGIARLKFEP